MYRWTLENHIPANSASPSAGSLEGSPKMYYMFRFLISLYGGRMRAFGKILYGVLRTQEQTLQHRDLCRYPDHPEIFDVLHESQIPPFYLLILVYGVMSNSIVGKWL